MYLIRTLLTQKTIQIKCKTKLTFYRINQFEFKNRSFEN